MESEAITINARPEPFPLVPARTAVVIVDMQNDFATAGGMFDRAGIPIEDIQAIVDPLTRVLNACRAAGILAVFLKMQFAPDLADAGGPDVPNRVKHGPLDLGREMVAPDGSTGRILVADTWNTEIVPALSVGPMDLVVTKHRYSGFYEARLHDVLGEHGIDTLIFTGATTSVCVESTLRDAFYRDYRCLLLSDCTAEPIAAGANHDATLRVVETLFGWVTDGASLLRGLGELPEDSHQLQERRS